MRIRTSGLNEKVSRKELRYAAAFMADLLVSKQLSKNLSILIKSVDQLVIDGEKCKACVESFGTPPRRFRISIVSSYSRRSQLFALAHELVHCKQYAQEELKDEIRNNILVVKWKKESMKESAIPYFWRPWEIDCYGHERALYYSYRDHLQKNAIRF